MFPDEPDAAAKIAALAFTEYGQWLTGENRPANLSEQSIRGISLIFSEILPNQIPDTSILVNNFGIPLGRARFILQAIGYQHTGEIRRRVLQNIRDALDGERRKLEDLPEEQWNDSGIETEITIASQADSLFRELAYELCREDSAAPEPRRARNLGTQVTYPVRPGDIRTLLNKIDDRIAAIRTDRP
jgi:hypothetical protein